MYSMMKRLLVAAALLAVVAPVQAQDVIEIGRRHGTPIPDAILERLAEDPTAFEFRRAWRSELAKVKRARAALRAQGIQPMALSSEQAARAGAAVSGTFRVPTIPVLYANTPGEPYPHPDLQEHLYGTSTAAYTITSYYDEVSRGLLNMTGTVMSWVQLSQDDTTYEGTDNGVGSDAELGSLLKEALDALDATVDFSQYDRDGDGYVDFVAFVHPEDGGECGTSNIWSHRWVYRGWHGAPYQTNDGVYIDDYVIQPAYNCGGGSMIDIGVFAHEYGHALDLPDLYDTAKPSTNRGIDVWGLMGAGNWNRPSSPAHMMAWSKAELGWVPVETFTADTTRLQIDPAATTGSVIRIDLPGTDGEYFLLENRQPLGSDQHVLGSGLLIWHVDSVKIAQTRRANAVQHDKAHKGVDLEEADGLDELDTTAGNADDGDPYVGSTFNTTFDDQTWPNSRTNAGAESGISVSGITLSGQTVVVDIAFSAPEEEPAVLWGDVDRSGAVELADAEAIFLEALGGSSGGDMSVADVDADGDVDIRDAFIVHSYVQGVNVSQFRVGTSSGGTEMRPAPAARATPAAAGVLREEGGR